MTTNTKNTFFAKAIENWLTNTNELGYQLPFCQLLLNEGFRTVHISKHNAFEQGKDIIAIAPSGVTHVYQLKGGNVTLSLWRNILKAEVEELIDLTVVHPSVDKTKPFVPYLVTNGYLDDTVRLQIENLNNSKWKSNPLQVVLLGDLLTRFIEWSYEFTPQEIENYKIFLELYFAEGSELVDEQRLSILLESILRISEIKLPNAERKRNIGAAVLLAGYIMSPFKERENFVALLQSLTILASYILGVAEKFQLKENLWKPSFDLVWTEISENLDGLEEEISSGGFENLFQTLWDGELVPYRRHVAISYLFAGKLARLLRGEESWASLGNNPLMPQLMNSLIIAGEGSLIAFIFLHLYLSKLEVPSNDIYLILPLELLLFFNGRKSTFGMPNPYYGIDTAIKVNLGLLEEDEVREDFLGRSFLMDSIIQLLVRANRRDVLERYWREISYIQVETFIPDETWKTFLWRTKEGRNVSEFPHANQSWNELCKMAQSVDLTAVPLVLQHVPFTLPFFLLVFPHRATPNLIKHLSSMVEGASMKSG